MCNAPNKAYHHGTPVFTGWADTHLHLGCCLESSQEMPKLAGEWVVLRRVRCRNKKYGEDDGCSHDIENFLSTMQAQFDNIEFRDVVPEISNVLDEISAEELERCFVAREGLGGALVVAESLEDKQVQGTTHLLKIDEDEQMDMKLTPAIGDDLIGPLSMDQKDFKRRIELGRGEVNAF